AGQIDLSVGALAGQISALSALAYTDHGWPLAAALVAAVALGGVLGCAQGALVAFLRVPAFIVTLGGMLLFQGALLGLTGGVSTSPPRPYLYVGQAYVPPTLGWAAGGLVAAVLLLRAWQARLTVARVRFAGLAVLTLL